MELLALNDEHLALKGKMVNFAGFNMPVQYEGVNAEHHTVRNGVGVFDVSHMGEFLLEGPNALDLIQFICSNDAAKLSDGQVQYSCFPNEKGGIVDDLLVYRFNAERFMLVVNASNIEKDWNWVVRHNNEFKAKLTNISSEYCLFAVQGPKSIDSLQSLTTIPLKDIPYYTFKQGGFAGVDQVIISATGYTGAGGFELYVRKEDAKKVWKNIFIAGSEFQIKPIGLAARDTLRLEMGYCLYGNDINDETSPIEAGLSWITKFNKDFVNKAALLVQKENGTSKKLMAFEVVDRGIPRQGYPLLNEQGQEIGMVTSGTMSPTLKKAIGMGYLNADYAKIGTEIFVAIRNKSVKAKVVKLPFV